MARLYSLPDPRRYECAVCNQGCLTDFSGNSVFCDECEKWRHVDCEQLTANDHIAYKELPPDFPYICCSCRNNSSNTFDFEKALKRLHKAAKQGYKKLQSCVARENLFIKSKFSFSLSPSRWLILDSAAISLSKSFREEMTKVPIKTTKGGSALFSAVSLALGWSEKFTTELRVRCCLEMVTHAMFYQWQRDHVCISQCAPDYAESCLDCASPDGCSSVWTISALASVIGIPIHSLYPDVNQTGDKAVSVLNTVFMPRQEVLKAEPIQIMWSSSKPGEGFLSGSWVPDHFQPLVLETNLRKAPEKSVNLIPSRISKRKRKPSAKLIEAADAAISCSGTEEFEMSEDLKLFEAVGNSINKVVANLDWQKKYTFDAQGGKPLSGNCFLSVQDMFEILTGGEGILPGIPLGRKENVYFVVDNTRNLKFPGRRNSFPDDCGHYSARNGTTVKSSYILQAGGRLDAVRFVNGKFCKEKLSVVKSSDSGASRVKERSWVPLTTQPNEIDIVTLHRYYAVLSCDSAYRRRISWFITLPPSVQRGRDVYMVEYLRKPWPGIPVELKAFMPIKSETKKRKSIETKTDE